MLKRNTTVGPLVALILLLAPTSAMAGIFGTNPLDISAGPNGQPGNAASGGPTISGDDRYARLAAFYSDASNLVSGDSNGVRDVFAWNRPHGQAGLSLNTPGAGSLQRVSVSSSGAQANGPSQNPALDGSMTEKPHCVVFESRATNLSSSDSSPDSDIYLRDLRTHRTHLLSVGIAGDATDPTIAGDCHKVAFQANGYVWTVNTKHPSPHRFRPGAEPSYSLDGKAIAWQQAGRIMLQRPHGTVTLGPGTNPRVSDASSRRRAVGFDSSGSVVLSVVGVRGNVSDSTVTPTNGSLTGVSAFAANRGIVTYGIGGDLYYLNRHTGNSDDIAHANTNITEGSASARSNFAAFTAAGGPGFVGDGNGAIQDVYFKHLVDGKRL